MATNRIMYEAVRSQADKASRKKLGELVQKDYWDGWYHYPFSIVGAPGENALMDSLRRYHDRQVVKVTFSLVAKTWETEEEFNKINLRRMPQQEAVVIITSLTNNMELGFHANRARYVFKGEVVAGNPKYKNPDAHEGKVIVGYMLTEVQIGGCYLFGESSPQAYRRMDNERSSWLHTIGCPITADELAAGDFTRVPPEDKKFQRLMFFAQTIHNEEVAGGLIPLSADWMQKMNPYSRWLL